MTRYTAYGLEIDSELPLPWLPPGGNGTADVKIRLGRVPTALPDPLGKGWYFEATKDCFLFTVRDTARYLVDRGQRITIDRISDGSEDLLKTFLMGSGFGALMHQRGLLVMHASSVQTNLGAVLFVGPSGHGKSTLLAALVDRGFAMLADDVTAIDVETEAMPRAFASFPRMRLGAEAAKRIGYSVELLLRAQHSGKYLVPVENFCAEAQPVHAVYALDVHDSHAIKVETLGPHERFTIVGNNTYRYGFLEALGLRKMHFHAAARLAKAVQVRRISRPASPFLLGELVAELEVELGKPTALTHE